MTPNLTQLLEDFEHGKMTRRQLMQALAAAALAVPASTFAQVTSGRAAGAAGADSGRGRGAGGRGGGAAAAPLPPPFEPTGWKTVWLDHFTYQCVDYQKAAAFYVALMGWKVRSDDGKQAILDIGDNSGGIIIRGGLTAPPPAAITDAGLGVQRPPVQAIYDGFAWGIDKWDASKVKDELQKRGLNPKEENDGDFKSFHIKDPDGFNLWITNGTKELRRKKPANGKLKVAAPFKPTNWNTLYLDHISFEVDDFAKSAAFYQALLGWAARGGGGQSSVQIGEAGAVGGAIIRGNANARARGRGGRGGDSAAAAAPPPPPPPHIPAAIGHISFGIENWNTERVRAELKERDVVYVNAQGVREPRPDMTGTLESFHVPDAMGWDLQIGNKIKA